MSIGELADAAGVSRRAVRFYVQRGLLPPPTARGRGAHYEQAHVERLLRILRLQDAGHSLAAVGTLLAEGDGGDALPAPAPGHRAAAQVPGALPAVGVAEAEARVRPRPQLVIRLRLAEGIELQLDAARYNPDAEALVELRDCVLRALRRGGTDPA
jgi:DNA-binding transcriptional MerR regulator